MSGGRISRRRLLAGAAAAGGVALGGGVLLDRLADEPLEVGAAPAGLPRRQHAWNRGLATDQHGNHRLPRFSRLLLFDLAGRPSAGGARRIEAVLRTLERRWPWRTDGLLFALGWGPSYFRDGIGREPAVPDPRSLASFEVPTLDDFAACLHLASDDEQRLATVQDALVSGGGLPGADGPTDLRPALDLRESRTGFTGAGLPAARQEGVAGIPSGCPVGGDAPLFMGFKSAFRGNQATEDAVTIRSGPLAGGTTMQVSRLTLGLDSWFGGLTEQQRVNRMFAPQLTVPQVESLTDTTPHHAGRLERTARRRGVIGHTQAAAAARRHDRPLILRRDFDSTDGGEAGLHFVALQASIEDFVRTREAMNAAGMTRVNPNVKPLVNNGIKEWFRVTNRANFVVPPRPRRAFPLL